LSAIVATFRSVFATWDW